MHQVVSWFSEGEIEYVMVHLRKALGVLVFVKVFPAINLQPSAGYNDDFLVS